MQRYKVLLVFLMLLSICFGLASCRRSKTLLKTIYIVWYYSGDSQFLGVTITLPADPLKYDRKLSSYTVFWNIRGQESDVSIPTPPNHASFCVKLNKIVVSGLFGVLVLPIEGSSFQWLLRGEDLLFLAMQAVSVSGEKMLLLANEKDSSQLLLVALDVPTGRTSRFEIPEVPSGMEFVDTDNAVASVGEDLVWVEFSAKGDHKFSIQESGAQKGAVWGVHRGEIIFHSENEAGAKAALQFGEITIPFEEPLKYVKTSDSRIWAVTREGQIFQISSNGSKSLIETVDLKKVIGIEAFTEGLWVVTHEGNVMVFGPEGQMLEQSKITLPQPVHNSDS